MTNEKNTEKELHCDFCNKSQEQVKKMVAGPGVYICNECIDLCSEIVEEDKYEEEEGVEFEMPKPSEIYANLDDYVIGQEKAKKVLAGSGLRPLTNIPHCCLP